VPWLPSLLALGAMTVPSPALAATGTVSVCKKAARQGEASGTVTFAVHDDNGDRSFDVAVGG
jgi:hypothetical protein